MPNYKYENDTLVTDPESKLPIVVFEDGSEKPYDVSIAVKKIAELNTEAKEHRLAKEKLAKDLTEYQKQYDGIDPATARDALEKVKNLAEGELLTADKVAEVKEKARKEIVDSYEKKIKDIQKKYETDVGSLSEQKSRLESEFFTSKLETELANSITAGVLGKKTTIANIKMAKGYFGDRFRMETTDDGRRRIVAYHWDSDRQIISTGVNAGDPASVEESLAVLFETDPLKSGIEKAMSGGSGSTGGSGGSRKAGEMNELDYMKEVFGKK